MKIWFITGASRGFGAQITQKVLDHGDVVIATARNPQHITERFGQHQNLYPLYLDVTDSNSIESAVTQVIADFGRIDILINNAGYGLLGAIEEASQSEIEKLYATNVFGVLAVTRAILPYMREAKAGHIMNISSIGGYSAGLGWGVYSSTKFAIEGLSEALSKELAPLNIHVTIIEPGYFRTDFLDQQSLNETVNRIADYDSTVGEMRQFAKKVNHQQPGNPEKLADAIIILSQTDTPPLRLALGSDTVKKIREKNHFVQHELLQWEELSLSTDFPVE